MRNVAISDKSAESYYYKMIEIAQKSLTKQEISDYMNGLIKNVRSMGIIASDIKFGDNKLIDMFNDTFLYWKKPASCWQSYKTVLYNRGLVNLRSGKPRSILSTSFAINSYINSRKKSTTMNMRVKKLLAQIQKGIGVDKLLRYRFHKVARIIHPRNISDNFAFKWIQFCKGIRTGKNIRCEYIVRQIFRLSKRKNTLKHKKEYKLVRNILAAYGLQYLLF